jgi:hypothetical protein
VSNYANGRWEFYHAAGVPGMDVKRDGRPVPSRTAANKYQKWRRLNDKCRPF